MQDDELLLSLVDIARLFNLPLREAERQTRTDRFPMPFTFGQEKRWCRRELENWLMCINRPAPKRRLCVPRHQVPNGLYDKSAILGRYDWREYGPCVYFLLDKGKVVYVGMTDCLPARVRQHQRGSKGTPAKEFDDVMFILANGREAAFLEKCYIGQFRPSYNIAHRF